MSKEIKKNAKTIFEQIKRTDKNGNEFWSARDLAKVLEYTDYRNFQSVINKAIESCNNSGHKQNDHIVEFNDMIEVGKGAMRPVRNVKLSRYACYLIAQNWDSKKQEIAFAQAYFAVQTRKQEIIEQKLIDYERLVARKKLTATEKEFQWLAYERWVDWAWLWRIRSKWDRVLFWWMSTQDMKNRLWVKSWPLADVLPAVTLKAKDLATEVTNHNMKNDNVLWENEITKVHIKNNQWVRKFLDESWIKPEELPAEEDLKKIERRKKSEEKKINKSNNK